MTKSNGFSDLLTVKSLHGIRSKVNQILKKETKKMANQNMQYIQGPKWTGLRMQAYTKDSKT